MRPRFTNKHGFGPRRDFGPHPDFGSRPDFGPGGPRGFGHRPGGPRDPFFGPEGHPLREFMRGRGHRARPGNLRAAILALLAEAPLNGYGLIQAISERSGGVWQPSSGAVYPALQLLEDEGLIQPAAEGSKRAYSLTDAGQTYVQEHAAELREPWKTTEGADDLRAHLSAMQSLMVAARQVAQVGSAEQRQAAQDILANARKALYKLLAEE